MFRQTPHLLYFSLKKLTRMGLNSRLTHLLTPLFISLLLLSLSLLLLPGSAMPVYAAPPATPRSIFTPATVMSPNLLTNSGFETGSPGNADDWQDFISGYIIDETGGRGGSRALQLINPIISDTHGASQVIILNQTEPRPLYFSGWSRAENVSGHPDLQYSIYLDIVYTDNTWLYGQTLQFDTGHHDWQFREGFIIPTKPIQTVYVYALLRWTHQGKAWFDDLNVQEVTSTLVFDGVPVDTNPQTLENAQPLTLATSDGLTLTLAAEGGAVSSIALTNTTVHNPDSAYLSGFLVRDVAAQGDFWSVGGSLIQNGNVVHHTSAIAALDLDFSATYTATADRITIHAEVVNTGTISDSERALTLYFALPISATQDWRWGDDIRNNRPISGVHEFASFSTEHKGLGANGHLSNYPWSSLSGPAGGIAFGVPLSSPRVVRLVYNPVTDQYYAAFDLGLSPHTTKFPNRASVDLMIYRTSDSGWDFQHTRSQGFRAAAQGYYTRSIKAFTRRIPPQREGIWVAFSDLCDVTDIDDFNIAFHEVGSDTVGLAAPCDELLGIHTFRYLAEPWSLWHRINRRPLLNPDFEDGPPDRADHWNDFGSGYMITTTGGFSGSRAIVLTNTVIDDKGAWQYVFLDQPQPWPFYFSGSSKAVAVSGVPDKDYSIYLDVYYHNGDALYGQILTFSTGTHDWEFNEGFIIPTDTVQAINYHLLLRAPHTGMAWFDGVDLWELLSSHDEVSTTVNSGFFDAGGRYYFEFYEPGRIPWCSGPAGCAVFTVNPDPNIIYPPYWPNKAHLEWNQSARDTYTQTPELDGEYIDSIHSHATVMDFRTDHFAAADIPLTFRTADKRVGIAQVFATLEFARWVADDVHSDLGKWMMANWILRDLPWGADLFDVMGTEINWLVHDGSEPEDGFVPESDATLSYRRTLAYQRPYGLLMNTNFITPTTDLPYTLTHDLVERYFQISLFYGLYPSMFSHNAANDTYWEIDWKGTKLYERDRELFRKYIPLIRHLNEADWEPVTYAKTNTSTVYIERFGNWPDLYFTLRNITMATTTVTVTLQADALKIPAVPISVTSYLSGNEYRLSDPAPTRTVTVTLNPQSSEVLDLTEITVPLNSIIINGPITGLINTAYTFTATVSPLTATQPITNTWWPTPSSGQGTVMATYDWPRDGVKTITVTATNAESTVTDTHAITISIPPTDVAISGPTMGRANTDYSFIAIVSPSTATRPIAYTWSSTPNSGQGTEVATYTWDTGGLKTIAVTTTNAGGTVSATHVITIDAIPPNSIIVDPTPGQILSGTYVISGIADDDLSGVQLVEISADNGESWQEANGTDTWNYPWTPSDDGIYVLTSRATDYVSQVEIPDSVITVTVDNTPPTATITTPMDGDVITTITYTISGAADDNLSGVRQVEVSIDNGANWEKADGTTSWSYTWAVHLSPCPGIHVILARAVDGAQNIGISEGKVVRVPGQKPYCIYLPAIFK